MSTTGSIILNTERLIILKWFDLNGTGMDEDLSDVERKEEELWE